MEVLKIYSIICISALYVCYVMRNFLVLLESYREKDYLLPTLFFILIILMPCIFEPFAVFKLFRIREEKRRRRSNEKIREFVFTDADNLDDALAKIKKIIEEDQNERSKEDSKNSEDN